MSGEFNNRAFVGPVSEPYAEFHECSFSGPVDIHHSTIYDCAFNCITSPCNFGAVEFNGATFTDCDLKGSFFTHTRGDHDFIRCDLRGCRWIYSDTRYCIFTDCIIDDQTAADMKKANDIADERNMLVCRGGQS